MLVPPEPLTPLVSLSEDDPLSLAPTYFPMEANGLLSDLGPYESMSVGLPPRVLDASLLKGMKQVGCRRWQGGAAGCWEGSGDVRQGAVWAERLVPVVCALG